MVVEYLVKRGWFRNENHAIWFIMSMWMFATSTGYILFPQEPKIILIPTIVHGTALIQAIYSTTQKSNSSTLSKDCIWFNFLLVITYISLYIVIKNK